jgi:cation diffusion facilitator CzcD-associated flavoprotein CzcO
MHANLKADCEVAVVGAGPYGLAVAAHLRGARIETHVFGEAMSFWRRHMPKGMRVRSSLTASDIEDPDGFLSLQSYANSRRMQLTYPMPFEDFVAYGEWFQSHAVADLDKRRVHRIERAGEQFSLWLDDGNRVIAKRVVVATGLAKQEFRPAQFAGLPVDLVSHTCDHDDLGTFRGKRVAVIGRGQSACESAALLNDAGADVELITRGNIHWLGAGSPDTGRRKASIWRSREILAAKSGVGPFPLDWVAEFPDLVWQMPAGVRAWLNARCLKAGATGWLKPRFRGVTIGPARNIVGARAAGSRISLQFDDSSAEFDHVLLATGYHIDIAKLGIFPPELLKQIQPANGSPLLSSGLESSVRGLHFVGASAVASYGPLMRFVAGSGYAARHLSRAVHPRRATSRSANFAIPRQKFSPQRQRDVVEPP